MTAESPTAPPASGLELRAVAAGYDDVPVLRDLNVAIPAGALTAVLGASGSGKTTMLRVIAGFLRPQSGTVTIGERTVAAAGVWIPPERRRVGIVPQEGALFPHLTVLGNVMFGLRRGQEDRAREVLEWVGMADRAGSRPQELSGGQQQRVALARALAPAPDVIVMDEPFSALDAGLRSSVRQQVREALRASGTTAILVTHDQDEALSMADEVAVMIGGRVVQTGHPEDIYTRPETLEVARFVGAVVEFEGNADAGGHVHCALGTWTLPAAASGPGIVVIRPEAMRLRPAQGGPANARVTATEYHGHDTVVMLMSADGQMVQARVPGLSTYRSGDEVSVEIDGAPMWFPR